MAPEPGVFEAFYASPLQHPLLLWAAAAAATAWAVTRPGLAPELRRYCLALGALSLADAWLSANHVYGFGRLEGAAARAVPLFFVLAGDFRYLLLLGAARADGSLALGPRPALAALGLTLAVPALSPLVVRALPAGEPRVLFLVYELSFFALTLVLLRWHPGHRRAPWLRAVSRLVLLYYGLWATADAVILAAGPAVSDAGFLLRVAPNVLYYGGLIAGIARAGAAAGHLVEDPRRPD